jgi:glyoxylase-like metal-dependent hydrolase (beta-lactamase superfamily II)
VAAGVHRIPLPLPGDHLKAVNVYALADGDGLTLIDSGWALDEARELLERSLASLGHELGDVRRFLVTHVHRDHYSLAMTVRRLFGARVLLGAGERESLSINNSGGSGWASFGRMLRHAGAAPVAEALHKLWGDGAPDPRDWEEPDGWLEGTEKIDVQGRTLRVIPTPGHTRGHVVFADDAAGLLFAGDHVLPHITPSIGFEPARTELPLGDYLASLRLVRSMPDMRLLPAHGAVTDSAHTRIDELIAHHEKRLDTCAAVIARGPATAYEAAQILTWTRRERGFGELDPFNQMMAVLETAAHLDVLVRQGRIRTETVAPSAGKTPDGVLTYLS